MKLAIGTARAMAYLHGLKPPVLHRDLKSLNILVGADWTPKICDFGFTVVKGRFSESHFVGTVQWVAPEIIQGKSFTEKAEIFSFGIVLWEIIARSAPYIGLAAKDLAPQVIEGLRPEIPHCSAILAALMRECWDVDPKKRPDWNTIISSLEKESNLVTNLSM